MNAASSILDNSRLYDVPAAQAPARPGSAMGKDEFLQLLVAQMSNQDPLNPAQGTEYVAQLAQFSSVEQLIQLNDNLGAQGVTLAQLVKGIGAGQDELLKHLQGAGGSALMGATSLIGKSVEASGGRALLEGGKGSFDVRVEGEAATGTLVIRDGKGNVVRRMEVDGLGAGTHRLDWDGRSDDDKLLEDGLYTATFEAKDAEGKVVKAEAFTRGEISRVSMTASGLTAWIGDLAVPVSALTSVSS